MNTETTTLKAKDLTREYPRSPRETLAGHVIAARMLDKCRATIAGKAGEYHFNCPLDRMFLDFTGIDAELFRTFVATGATDVEVAAWIDEHATSRPRIEVIKWNNRIRDMRLSDLPDQIQEHLEGYIPKYLPEGSVVYHFLDVFDIEEKRL
jgi:Domain of unknown function (DUF5069)